MKEIDEDTIHAIVEEQVLKAIEKQKAIDIEKAKMWLLKNGFVDMNSSDCDIHFKSGYIHDFVKAMEG